MKLALFALAILAFLIVCSVIVGLLLPKEHAASRSASFKASPERLFALIEGPQTWRSSVKHYEEIAPADGHRRWRETDTGGETITYEAVERRPPTWLKTRIVTPGLPYTGTWTLSVSASRGATLLRITEQGEIYNPLFRFVSRFVLGPNRTIDAYLRDLAVATGEGIEVRD